MIQKSRLTTTLDADLKYMFESVKSPDASYSKLLEDAVKDYIKSVSPEALLKHDIECLEQTLVQKKTELEELEIMSHRQKKLEDFQKAQLEKFMPERVSKYDKFKNSLSTQVKKGTIDWKLVAKVYYFQDDTESAREWIMSQLKKDSLL
ncbi:hypothetical protein [Methanolobus vulcani]|uniref:Uncharacterized protein n=1 Tax=Methanolobus vulcani TaxID=38026 RepID=A0A7Z8P1U8_9EURY|nr:hypothetical protein [Methanolobus vulcani]TQD24652.1 hypothetical protein FKV42_10385 [Methanolobus vulcani]